MVALVVAFVATTMGTLVLRKYGFALRAKSQLFRFHELRDRLQLLAIEKKILPTSSVYNFLEFSINLAIKNAGIMKRSQLLKVAKDIDCKRESTQSRDIFSEITQQSEDVQALAAEMFNALYSMLIANDGLTKALATTIELATHKLRGVVRTTAKSAMRLIFPERSKAAREAIKFRHISERLASAA